MDNISRFIFLKCKRGSAKTPKKIWETEKKYETLNARCLHFPRVILEKIITDLDSTPQNLLNKPVAGFFGSFLKRPHIISIIRTLKLQKC